MLLLINCKLSQARYRRYLHVKNVVKPSNLTSKLPHGSNDVWLSELNYDGSTAKLMTRVA